MFILAYEVNNGKYPSSIEDLKPIYLKSRDIWTWDTYVINQWNYYKPNPRRDRQVILEHKDYDISFEAVYKDGKAIDYKTYSQWDSLHKKDEHIKKQK